MVYAGKLFQLQILDENYRSAANKNVMRPVAQYPYRGLIFDGKDQLLVFNNPVFDLMVIPKDMNIPDTAKFCQILELDIEELRSRIEEVTKRSRSAPQVFLKQLSNEDFARFQDVLIDHKGFYFQPRTLRTYPTKSFGHLLGYIGEISGQKLASDTSNYYSTGDYIGISGLERRYEDDLRGKRGVQYKMVNVRGVEKGKFRNGSLDSIAVAGENLFTDLDLDLQQYAEKLLEGKRGSVVAIDPKTGAVLAMVSSPYYDPNLLSGRFLGKNYVALSKDSLLPLFNRPAMATYPPGSIFKMVQALIALEEGVIDENTYFNCNKKLVKCHNHVSPTNVRTAIANSCNPFFYRTFNKIIDQDISSNVYDDLKIGLNTWHQYLDRFNLTSRTGIDLPSEGRSFIPDGPYYDKQYGEKGWRFGTIYSLSIGQEMTINPIQMANLAAILANRGHYYRPHMITGVGERGVKKESYLERLETGISPQHFENVLDGMQDAVRLTAPKAFDPRFSICGKTGTAQNSGRDHSVFMAFAPRENPQIALSVYVENAGWGGDAAGSTASLLIEKYLTNEITRTGLEAYVLKGKF